MSKYQGRRMVKNDLIAQISEKQDKLTAGTNITIEDGVISATDTTYTAGPGIEIASDNLIRTNVSIAGGLNYNNNGNMIVDNSVVAFKSDLTAIPNCEETTDGTYVLKATVSSGVVTYTWVLEV